MTPDKSIVIIAQYAAIAILFLEFVFVSIQKPSNIQRHAIVLTISTLLMFVGYTIELTAVNLEEALTGTAVSYIGKPYVLLASFLFICSFYRRQVSPRLIVLLSVLCASFSVLVFSNSSHHLYYATTEFDSSASFSPLVLTHGPLYYLYVVVAVAYFLACLFVAIQGSKQLKERRSKKLNSYIIIMLIAGISGYIVFLAGLTGSYDSTMIGMFIGVICLFMIYVRCHVFDIAAIGKEKILNDSDLSELYSYQSKLESDVKHNSEKLAQIQRAIIGSVAGIIEARNIETGEHVMRTGDYTTLIARRLYEKKIYPEDIDEKFIELLDAATPLHDIGKLSIPDHILLKPGKLTEEEYSVMKTHSESGARIIEKTLRGVSYDDFVDLAIDVARYHHEWWNGKGYPEGLSGEEIPVGARIVAVADCFDAIMSRRCYKEPYDIKKSVEIIKSESGTHFDPVVVEAFIEIITPYLK